jgi:competence protein ComEC
LLYDAGPTYGSESDSGERIIVPYLRAVGALRLDAMFVTHNDSDHSGGALSVLQGADVLDFQSSLEPGNPIVAGARNPRRCLRGDRWVWDGVAFEVLHPAGEDYAGASLRTNNLSCVLRIATVRGAMLLTGDIEKAAEALLVQRGATALRAEVLLAPHHGSRTSSTAEFIAAVRPGLLVVAAGYRNRFGHPRPDVLARYDANRTRVLRTDLDGAVTVSFAADGMSASGERSVRPRYWHASRL